MLTENERKLVDRLPGAARSRFVKICVAADALSGSVWQASDRRTELRSNIEVEEIGLQQLVSNPAISEGDAIVILARESIARNKAEMADLEAAMAAHAARRAPLQSIITDTLDALAKIPPGMQLQVLPRSAPTLKKGEDHTSAVEQLRLRIQQLRGEAESVADAPYPAALAKERASEDINRLAAEPDVTAMIRDGEPSILWPTKLQRVNSDGTASIFENLDTIGVMAWLFKEQLLAAVERKIDEAADDANALTPAERKTALEKIAAEMDEIERSECAMIEAAEKAGTSIAHRRDVNIYALLGLSKKLVPAPAAKAEPYRSRDTAPTKPAISAPEHTSALPEPARRDAIWQ